MTDKDLEKFLLSKNWNTVIINAEMVDDSYDLVVSKLTKKEKSQL